MHAQRCSHQLQWIWSLFWRFWLAWQKGLVIASSPSKSDGIYELKSSFYTWIHLSFTWVNVPIVSEEICATTDPISCCRCQFWCCMKLSLFFPIQPCHITSGNPWEWHRWSGKLISTLGSQSLHRFHRRNDGEHLTLRFLQWVLYLTSIINLCLCSFNFCLLYIYLCLFFIWRSSSPDQRSCPVYRYPTLSPSFSSSFSSLSSTSKQMLSTE